MKSINNNSTGGKIRKIFPLLNSFDKNQQFLNIFIMSYFMDHPKESKLIDHYKLRECLLG